MRGGEERRLGFARGYVPRALLLQRLPRLPRLHLRHVRDQKSALDVRLKHHLRREGVLLRVRQAHLLRHVVHADIGGEAAHAPRRDELEQSRLALAVPPDQPVPVPRCERQHGVVQQVRASAGVGELERAELGGGEPRPRRFARRCARAPPVRSPPPAQTRARQLARSRSPRGARRSPRPSRLPSRRPRSSSLRRRGRTGPRARRALREQPPPPPASSPPGR